MARPRLTSDEYAVKFWSRVNVLDEDDCWEWTAHRVNGLYGQFWTENQTKRGAHVVAFEYANRTEVPDGIFTCHTCDNPACCNPKHLFLGTPKDNNDDKLAKGRGVVLIRSKHSQAKLTENDVKEIRQLLTTSMYQRDIAKQFGVSAAQISSIKLGKAWADNNKNNDPTRQEQH